MEMEGYLGNLFNHGAWLVNLFGWGVGDANNPFRNVAQAPSSIAAYRKFQHGEQLREEPIPLPQFPSAALAAKMRTIQQRLTTYLEANGPNHVASLMQLLESELKQRDFAQADKLADRVLQIIS